MLRGRAVANAGRAAYAKGVELVIIQAIEMVWSAHPIICAVVGVWLCVGSLQG